ncbi:MAG: hypothetical protein V8Q17_09000 [Acutalibacteraceae bacterium]
MSERKVLKNVKVRIYVPADQNITVKVGDYQYLTTKVEKHTYSGGRWQR